MSQAEPAMNWDVIWYKFPFCCVVVILVSCKQSCSCISCGHYWYLFKIHIFMVSWYSRPVATLEIECLNFLTQTLILQWNYNLWMPQLQYFFTYYFIHICQRLQVQDSETIQFITAFNFLALPFIYTLQSSYCMHQPNLCLIKELNMQAHF